MKPSVELRGCPPLFRYGARRTLLLIDRGADGAPVGLTTSAGTPHPMTALGVPAPGPPGPRAAGPRAARARARSAPAGALAGADPAAAGPEPAADLTCGPVSQTPTEPSDYALLSTAYAALLAGTAVSARRRAPIAARGGPGAGRRDVHALQADRPREGRDVAARAVRGGAARRAPPPARPAAALRGRRAAHVHALHRRMDRARARRAAPARAGDRAHGQHRARRVGGQRLPARRLQLDLRPREHAGARGRAVARRRGRAPLPARAPPSRRPGRTPPRGRPRA